MRHRGGFAGWPTWATASESDQHPGKRPRNLAVFCGIKRGAAGGSTQRPAPLTTIEVEARPWLTTTIELPRLGCARIAALLRSRTRTARWCGAVPTGAQNSRRAPIWLPAPRFIRTSCAVPMRAASRPTRCPIAGKRGATGSLDRVEAARCRFGASASSDVTINRGDEGDDLFQHPIGTPPLGRFPWQYQSRIANFAGSRLGADLQARLRGSARLAKFQHVDIDRLSGGMRVGVAGIPGNAQEIAVFDQFESRRLDLRRDQRFVRR
jgi:hypothetical protein